MAKKQDAAGLYIIENHSKLIRFKTGARRRYYHRLVCINPKNIISSASHMSRSGRLKAIRRIKENPRYAQADVIPVKK